MRLCGREDVSDCAFWRNEATDDTMHRVDAAQRLHRGVRIDRKKHPRNIGHLAEQRFADGRILVRLLILAVFPGVRTDDQWYPEPLGPASRLLLVTREDNLLTKRAQHLDGKG